MRKILLLLFILTSTFASATHIVGGEFELTHKSGSRYQLTLNLYFDNANGNPQALDPDATVSIFSKSTNLRKADVFLPKVSESFVPYTNIACTIGSLSTKKILYSAEITLLASVYNEPQGYYISWERCCRNNTIVNIVAPNAAGQAFYLEFPPVVRNNVSFINSSPRLFPPLSDYACQNTLFHFDFSGTDPDGDSLAYDMVTPLNGSSSVAIPRPQFPAPGPYSEITWVPPLSSSVQIPGNPSMYINPKTGLLTVLPVFQGLYVFGIRCQEYRKGVKIGEVRRDFQLLVISCPTNNTPQSKIKIPTKSGFYNTNDTIRISGTTNRCLSILSTDPDPDEILKVSIKPVNFSGAMPTLVNSQGNVNRGGVRDTLKTTMCFSDCYDTKGKVRMMDVIIEDNGCSLPKKDTVRIKFIVDPIPNQPQSITIPQAPQNLTYKTKLGDVISFDIFANDPDNDLITLTASGKGFNINSQNIQFAPASGRGNVSSKFTWNIDCEAVKRSSFTIDFNASTRVCDSTINRTISITFIPEFKNNAPSISSTLTQLTQTITHKQPFIAQFFGTDSDNDKLTLKANPDGFNLQDYGMKFPTVTGTGNVQSEFSWIPDCNAVRKGEFQIRFELTEENCIPAPTQVILLTLKVVAKDNSDFSPSNIFTPNGDGKNDIFELPPLSSDNCEPIFNKIKVYSRWGHKVFESKERSFSWNGEGVSDGTYHYVIEFEDRKPIKGWVTIVR